MTVIVRIRLVNVGLDEVDDGVRSAPSATCLATSAVGLWTSRMVWGDKSAGDEGGTARCHEQETFCIQMAFIVDAVRAFW